MDASTKPKGTHDASDEAQSYHGKLIRKLALACLSFIAVGVALNCAFSYLNTRSTYIDSQSARLKQIGSYAIDSVTTTIDASTTYEAWVAYKDSIVSSTDRNKAIEEVSALDEQLDAVSNAIDAKRSAGESTEAEERLFSETANQRDASDAAYTYLSVKDMLTRLSDVYQIGHVAFLVPDAQTKTITYLAESTTDDGTAEHQIFDTASYAEGYDELWRLVETGESMKSVSLSPDGNSYLMFVPYESGDTIWIVELSMSTASFEASVRAQMLNTFAVSCGAFALCLIAMLAVLRRTLVLPIETLAGHVRDYGRTKNPGEAASIREEKLTHDEIGSLALSTANMIDQIQDHMQKVSRLSAEKERVASELAVAHRIQISALPPVECPYTGEAGFTLSAVMDPAKEVGGDFYDFFMVDERRCAVLIADVSGKGVPAALFMMRAKTLLRQLLGQGLAAAEAMSYANDGLVANNDEDMFVTVWLAVLDIQTGILDYSNGGHNPPLLRRADGNVEWLRERSGFFLGSFEGIAYKGKRLQMAAGDTLILYTDGVTEAIDVREDCYGDDRLHDLLANLGEKTPDEFVHAIRSDVAEYAGEADQADDITILALRYDG